MSQDAVDVLARTAGDLKVTRRTDMDRWVHLSLCVLDAVYSVGARYAGVVRVCRTYGRHTGLEVITLPDREASRVIGTDAEQSLDAFVADIQTVGVAGFAAGVVRHRGRTSTRNGILKADAALQYAETLLAHDIRVLADVTALLADPARLAAVEDELRVVPGNGAADVRLGYLWMLAGDDEHVKPDRMVQRWITHHLGRPIDPAQARDLIAATAQQTGHTPWELDHAIWRRQSRRNP